jgi:hypothetical protein
MDYLEKFNQTFQEFLADFSKTFPNDTQLSMYQLGLRGVFLADPNIVQTVFHDSVCVPYADKILAKDEAFFLENSYSEIQANVSNALDVIDKVKSYWSQLDTTNKDVVWKYLKVLVHLDRKIAA